MGNEELIFNAIKNAGKPVNAGDVAESTGIEKAEVTKIITKLKKRGKISSPKRCFYTIVE